MNIELMSPSVQQHLRHSALMLYAKGKAAGFLLGLKVGAAFGVGIGGVLTMLFLGPWA